MRRFLLTLCWIAGVVIAANGPRGFAQDANAPAVAGDAEVTWDQVRAVFQKRCFACHRGEQARGALDLSSVAAIRAGGSTGAAVISGKPEESLIYVLPAHLETPRMPPSGNKLPQRELDLIHAWISGGLSEKPAATAPQAKTATVAARVPAKRPAEATTAAKLSALTPEMVLPRENVKPAFIRATARPVKPQLRPVTALASSPASSLIAVPDGQRVLVYDWTDLSVKQILKFPGDVFALRFSRDGRILIAGGGVGSQSGLVKGWETTTGEELFSVGSEPDIVLAADISPDGRLIALGGPAKVVRVYDSVSGQLIGEQKKHTDWILELQFSRDGLLLASGDRFGTVLVSEAATAAEFAVLRGHTGPVSGFHWAAESDQLTSSGHDGTVRTWNLHNATKVSQFSAGAPVLTFDHDPAGALLLGLKSGKVSVTGLDGSPLRNWSLADEAVQLVLTQDGSHTVLADATGNVQLFRNSDGQVVGEFVLPATDNR
ncbi:MAG: c-type cytochrome domain-containing protein [Planctomycetaceae bacterium]